MNIRQEFREFLNKSLNEIQLTGEQNRGEFSAEKDWVRINKLSKLISKKMSMNYISIMIFYS